VRDAYAGEGGWRLADLREDPGDFTVLFVELEPAVVARYGRRLLAGDRWLQRRTKYGDLSDARLAAALDAVEAGEAPPVGAPAALAAGLAAFVDDVREEYFTALAHVIDSRYYRTHGEPGAPAGKFSAKRRGYVVSMGQDLGAVKISGWTHTIPEYFDFARFWAGYPGFAGDDPALKAHVWGMHHRYPTNSPAIDAEGRGNPAGAHPFKAFNVLLMHNGEQVGVDSTAPFLAEYGYVHTDASMGDGHADYEGDSAYDRKALTDTEYAAYLVDFTRRILGLSTEDASQVISPITGLDLEAMDAGRRRLFELLSLNYIQLTPTGPYKFTIVESRPAAPGDAAAEGAAARRVGFRENMDIKFLRPHELVVSIDTGPGGVHVVANGSEAKIADSMLRVLHDQGVLKDAGHDLRFNMRPGGNPGRGEFGGVVEAFITPGDRGMCLRNRFGETLEVPRAGVKTAAGAPAAEAAAGGVRRDEVTAALAAMTADLPVAADGRRLLGPDDPLPPAAARLVETTLEQLAGMTGEDYRSLVETALPAFALESDEARAVALRVLTELRKRVSFADLGGKALSSVEYLTDGGRGPDGSPEGGIYRVLDAVPPLAAVLAAQAGSAAIAGRPRYARLTLATRDDLLPPTDAGRDVLVIDFAGFQSETFGLDCASRIVTEAVRLGWRNLVGYGCVGGPRYLGCNLPDAYGAPARGVVLELYGREVGDFLGALLEGADIHLYGQGQCHLGMKAGSGSIFVLQDALNTCCYAAHGGSFSTWDSGSRFAVAGQNKLLLEDGETPAQGFRSIHFGTPNEYAFEYLMSGGDNSLHVVLGLAKPDAHGDLGLKAKPYFGKFFMSGAAAGRVFVFDPEDRLDPAQYHGNVLEEITEHEWRDELAPFLAAEAARRGVPLRIEGDDFVIRLLGEWRRWRYDECFIQLVPQKVSRRLTRRGVTPPQLTQLVEE
jgi:glutamate synthase domain-containing protein 3